VDGFTDENANYSCFTCSNCAQIPL